MSDVYVNIFGSPVKAIKEDGSVLFDKASFIRAVGPGRAQRIFTAMDESFTFLGSDGVDWLVQNGKEHMLCQLVLMDSNAPEELVEYARAWVEAYGKLAVIS